MKGMIKKDLLMIKNNHKTIMITLAIYIFYSIVYEIDMSFFLPFMGLMLCISTINYDEYNNWNIYATSLPQGRINVVKSKYISTTLVIAVLTIISFILSLLFGIYKNNLNINESIQGIMVYLITIMFIMSLMYPILFKYGSEKARIAMIIIGFIIFGITMLVTKVVNIEISKELIKFLETYLPIIFIVSVTVIILFSFYISKKIYLKREF